MPCSAVIYQLNIRWTALLPLLGKFSNDGQRGKTRLIYSFPQRIQN